MTDLQTTFARFVKDFDSTMTIVTVAAGERRSGCLVGFSTATSVRPPLFLACISRANHTAGVAAEAGHAIVHVVPAGAFELARLFGGQTGDEVDKFARCAWRPGPAGVPLLEGVDAWFAGRIVKRLDVGDHVGLLLDPLEAAAPDPPVTPLRFRRAREIEPGHPA